MYIMIFTLLCMSNILQNNPHRFIYIYATGVLIYSIMHWLLFSPMMINEIVVKYRYILYLIVSGDIAYVAMKYREFIKTHNSREEYERKRQHGYPDGYPSGPTFENLEEVKCDDGIENDKKNNNDNVTDNTANNLQKENNVSPSPPDGTNDGKNQNDDSVSLPIYTSNK